jgi:hypothetical protein
MIAPANWRELEPWCSEVEYPAQYGQVSMFDEPKTGKRKTWPMYCYSESGDVLEAILGSNVTGEPSYQLWSKGVDHE